MTDDERNIDTQLANMMFAVQKQLETRSIGMDWKQAFVLTAQNVLETVGASSDVSREKVQEAAEVFLSDFCAIPMRDTVYHDVPDALQALATVAGHVVLWTRGDVVNTHQAQKVEQSGIGEMLRLLQEKHEVNVTELIAARKMARTVEHVDARWRQAGEPEQLVISVYEDSVENSVAVDSLLRTWASRKGVALALLHLRATLGRRAHEPTPQDLPISVVSVTSLTDAVDVMRGVLEQEQLTRNEHIALLDFDGALCDNRLMRCRQAGVMEKHLRMLLSPDDQHHFDKHYWYEQGSKTGI